jgi:hypothetical protein
VVAAGGLPPNPTLNKILTASIGAQAAALLLPGIRNLFGVAPVGVMDAVVALAGGTLPFVASELRKQFAADGASPAFTPPQGAQAPAAQGTGTLFHWLRTGGAKPQ